MRIKVNDAVFEADLVQLVAGHVWLNGRPSHSPEDERVRRVELLDEGAVMLDVTWTKL